MVSTTVRSPDSASPTASAAAEVVLPTPPDPTITITRGSRIAHLPVIQVAEEFCDVVKPLDAHAAGQRRHARDGPGPFGGEVGQRAALHTGAGGDVVEFHQQGGGQGFFA